MSNGWTGGQYSLFRVVFGVYLLLRLLPREPALMGDAPAFRMVLVLVASVFCLLLGLGLYDRAAAWVLLSLALGAVPWSWPAGARGAWLLGCVLLAHAFLPPAPYGSWAARGRPDPAGSWHMPRWLHLVAWVLLALATAHAGYARLWGSAGHQGTALVPVLGVFELAFAPLALLAFLRPWLWCLMLLARLAPAAVGDFGAVDGGLVMLHGFAFDPGWIPPRRAAATEQIFYDGHCGLCHRSVRFVLAEDRTGNAFRFAPIESEAFERAFPDSARDGLPDSMIVRTAEGTILTRSTGVAYILERLGGVWRLLGALGGVVPEAARDALYDGIARVRHQLFRRPPQVCPVVPAHLQARFDN
jgi:predicted DCC family thiol-disulfide oxidoreductase YuxK